MRKVIVSGAALVLVAGILSLLSFRCKDEGQASTGKPNGGGKGFAVLELFTSEGCSSCPPADELFASLQQEMQGKDVYLLAFHVDYWNRLGWKDPYSSAAYTERQAAYGRWFNLSSVYTPQVVINGRAEFVGSSASGIREQIGKELAGAAENGFNLRADRTADGLLINYKGIKVRKGGRLLVAVMQKSAETNVERGENAGRHLTHVQVVRQLHSEALNGNGEGNFIVDLPKGFNTQDWEVIGFVQDQGNGEILAAARAVL